MIPSDIRLYTWLDVEEVLLRMGSDNQWPDSVIWARAYWDVLTLGIKEGANNQDIQDWLKEVYEERFVIESEQCYLILESTLDNKRRLPVFFKETEKTPVIPKLTPALTRRSVVWRPTSEIKYPESLAEDLPPVISFHSFKGGVGRTTHALALAHALTQEKYRVLLIDGDLEAPGISWLLEKRFPSFSVSLADLLALVHGEVSPDGDESIALVSDRLKTMQIDDIYILPAFRSNANFLSLDIKPEHLIQGSKHPFIFTDILAKLGKSLQVDAVIIDLRAGLSELATGLILDPRVYRVFVTTLSSQSVSGTQKIQNVIKEKYRSLDSEEHQDWPTPAFIIAKVRSDQNDLKMAEEVSQKLLENYQKLENQTNNGKNHALKPDQPLILTTNFADSLIGLPDDQWEGIMTALPSSGIVANLTPLITKWLPVKLPVDQDQNHHQLAETTFTPLKLLV